MSPWIYVLAAGLIISIGIAVYYIAVTVHGGSTNIDCMKHAFDQLLTELEKHHKLTAPPTC